jgi:hypothetical protein
MLSELVKTRPVVYDVLGHYLHHATDEIRQEQSDLFGKVQDIREWFRDRTQNVPEDIEVDDDIRTMIFISANALKKWMGKYHEWAKPTERLLSLIDGDPNVSKEPDAIPDCVMEYDQNGRYQIIHGCRRIIKGEYCGGTMVCLNWKKDEPVPRDLFYLCLKCNNSKVACGGGWL